MSGRLPLLVAAALALPLPAAGQADRLIDRWGVDEGLPNYAVTDVRQSRDGYLWVASWAGVSRFDGVRFTPIAEDLPNNHATALFEDREGRMWVGVPGTGLSRWQDGHLDTFTTAEGLAGIHVRAIAQDTAGSIWVATENGVSILDGNRIRTLRTSDGLPHITTTDLAPSRDGRVWVASAGGICVASAADARCVPVPGAPTSPADAILEDREGRVWIGSRQGIAILDAAGAPHGSCHGRCLAAAAVSALLETRNGDIWAGLDTAGVARIHAGGIERFGEAEGMPAGRVESIAEDLEGSVWFGIYYGGLVRIKPKRVTTYSTEDGLPTPAIGSIVQDRAGDIWVGSQCGPPARLRDGRFVRQFVDTLAEACAWVLWPARDGSLWIGTRGDALFRWDGATLERFDAARGLSDTYINALFEDRDGTIWIGTEFGGVHTFSGGVLSREYTAEDGLATKWIASFGQDRTGRIWIGSNANGLSYYEGGRFFVPDVQPPTRNIAGLYLDSRGDMWVGSAADGLFRYRNGRYDRFGLTEGLGDRLVAVILEDEDGHLWVTTTRGISRLDRQRIEAVADGRAVALNPIIIDRRDGMRNPEGSGGGFHPSGLRDREGRLWISTIDGIAMIDPHAFPINAVVPGVLVEGVTLDDVPRARLEDGTIEVPAGTTAIEIGYTAFSFMAPAKMRFEYRLAGFDDVWHDVGGRRVAYYSRLPPGEYAFEVRAANNDGVWSAAPATARVIVAPFWWERRSTRAAGLALLLIATGAAVSAVVQRRARRRLADLERERALDRERTRIARDLHDDLGSRLTHIALMADGSESTDPISSAARAAVETLDELVWTVNARNDTAEGFATYAARFAEEHVSAAGIRLRLHFAPDLHAHELIADTRRHLYLAFKEAVNNAVKHARASEIHVAVAVEDGALRLEVADDGQGLAGPGDPTGNGLANMRERMQSVGGTLVFDKAQRGGLRVVFRAPVSAPAVPLIAED